MALSYTTKWASFQASGTGSWVSYDLYTNQSVPKGAVAEIIVANANASAEVVGGVRKKGSSLTRSIALHEAEAGGLSHCRMFVQTDASDGTIEVYAGDTNIYFRLIAYWEGVTFTELASQITLATASAWTDATISDGVANQVHHMIFLNNEEATNNCGIRAKSGSPIGDRYILMHEAESGGSVAVDFIVKTDGSKYIQYYTPDTTNTSLYCYGYFSSDMDYVEDDRPSVLGGTATGWRQDDLSAYMDQDGRVVDLYCFHEDTLNEINVGARNGDDSTTNRYVLEQETEGGGRAGASFSALSNATGLVYLYRGSITASYVYFMGYFKPGAAYEYAAGTMSGAGTLAAKASVKKKLAATVSGAGNFQAAADKFIPKDDFEWGADEDDISAWFSKGGKCPWTVSVPGSCTAKIDTAYSHGGTRSARIYRDASNWPAMDVGRDAKSLKYDIEVWIYRDASGSGGGIYHGDGAHRIRFGYGSTDGRLYYYDHASTYTEVSPMVYIDAGAWHKIRLTNINFGAATPSFDIWLEDVKVASACQMEASTESVDKVQLLAFGASHSSWFDDFDTPRNLSGSMSGVGTFTASATKLGQVIPAAATMSGVGNFSAAASVLAECAQPFICGTYDSLDTVTHPQYIQIQGGNLWQSTVGYVATPIPTGGTFKRFRVKLSNPVTGNPYTFTIYKNSGGGWAATDITCTVAVGSDYAQDLTHEAHFNAGDLVCLQYDWSSAPTNSPDARWGFDWVPDIRNEFIFLSGFAVRTDVVTSFATLWNQGGNLSTSEYTAYCSRFLKNGKLKKFYGWRNTAPGSGNTERWRLRLNAADTDCYFDLTGSAQQGNNTTDEVTIDSTGDYVTISMVETGGSCGSSYVGWGLVWVPDYDAAGAMLPYTMGLSSSITDEYYFPVIGTAMGQSWVSSEFARLVPSRFKVVYAALTLNGALEAGVTLIIYLMRNGVEKCAITITAGNTSGTWSGTEYWEPNDLISIHADVSGGTTARSAQYRLEAYRSPVKPAAATFSGVGNMAAAATEIVPVIVSAAASFSGAGNLVGALTNRGVLTKQPLFGGNGHILNNAATEYSVFSGWSPEWAASRAYHDQVMPTAGKIRCLEIELSASTSTNPYTLTIMKNGTATNLAVTVPNGNLTARNDNESDVVTVAAGDFISIRSSYSSSPDTQPFARWSVIFLPTSGDETLVLGGGYCPTAPTRYATVQNQYRLSPLPTSDSFGSRSRWPVSGQLSKLYVYVVEVDTDIETFTLYKNGTATSLEATYCNGVASPDTTHTVDVAAGDYLQMRISDSSTIPTPTVSWAMVFKPTVRGQCVYAGATGQDATSGKRQPLCGSTYDKTWDGWNTVAMNGSPALGWRVKKFLMYQDTAPGSGTGRTFALNQSGSLYLSVTISDSETNETAESETEVPVLASYDTLAIECSSISGTPAASAFQFAVVGTCVKGGPQYGAASFSGAGNMAAAAVRRRAVNGTLSGAGNLVGLVVRRRQLLGTMSGAGTLAANVVRRRKLLGTMSGVGTFAAKAVTRRVISATASGVGTLAAKAVRRRAVLGTMSGAGTLTAKAIAKWRLLGTMSGVGSLHADATIAGKVNIKGTLSGVGTLAAKAVYRTRAVACSMSATGTLAAKATVRLRVQIAATMSGAGSLAANAVRRRPISASLSGAGTLGANAVRQRTMAATMSGAGHLSALGIKKGLIEATASMSGVGLMRAYAIFRGLGGLLYGKAMVVVMVKASGCTVQRLRGTGGLAERLDSDIHVA